MYLPLFTLVLPKKREDDKGMDTDRTNIRNTAFMIVSLMLMEEVVYMCQSLS